MPRVSEFHGIVIYMYWNEGEHRVPHFHATQGGRRASVALDGTVLAGGLDARALRLLGEWAALHQAELEANWERARRSEPVDAIAPLP
jgi:hypothetical protein